MVVCRMMRYGLQLCVHRGSGLYMLRLWATHKGAHMFGHEQTGQLCLNKQPLQLQLGCWHAV